MHRNNILTEAGASNLFFIKDGQVCTPSLSNNILPGITRSILISALSEAKINVLESNFSLYDLQQASSAWLTSSTKGIAPIKDILNVEHTLDHNDNFYLECKKIFDVKFFS
jgi:branched-subunit amino acid aminotransferase/4-amino-4-deoxychorismate lyase